MRRSWILMRRELHAMLVSPLAYVMGAIFVAGVSLIFLDTVRRYEGGAEPLVSLLLASVALWLPILVTVATMRSFAEERHSGTIEGLMTAPVEDIEVVLGKFLASWLFCVGVVVLPFANAFWLVKISRGIPSIDMGAVVTSLIYLILVLAAFCSVGVLASLCSRSQAVAAVLCLGVLIIPLFSGLLADTLPGVPDALARHLSAEEHVLMVSRGVLPVGVIVLFLSICGCFLFAAVRVLEARRWVR
jgi:ABC-2 type transport system permease protein